MSYVNAGGGQAALAAHLRDPDGHAAPAGMDPDRLAVYRDLFFNNVESLLANFFPVLRSLYAADDWLALARAFYAQHRARTPYFLEIAGEFVGFLECGYQSRSVDPPFLRALAHYEWLELVLDVADEEIPSVGIEAQGDLQRGVPVINPLVVLARYDWPVHRVSALTAWPAVAETWLLVWRDRADRVRFQELNALSARLFMHVRDNTEAAARAPGDEVLRGLVAVLGETVDDRVLDGARQLLESWRARDVVLGTAAG